MKFFSALLVVFIFFKAADCQAQTYAVNSTSQGISGPVGGGDYDFISADNTQPLSFAFETVDDLMQDNIIPGAIDVQVNAKQESYNVTASINFTGNVTDPAVLNCLAIKLANNPPSGAGSLNTQAITLSPNPALLFYQPKTNSQIPFYTYNYNLIFKAQTTMIKPGNYSYNITFTMTRP